MIDQHASPLIARTFVVMILYVSKIKFTSTLLMTSLSNDKTEILAKVPSTIVRKQTLTPGEQTTLHQVVPEDYRTQSHSVVFAYL